MVDDEANIVELARLYLEKEGFRVEEASTGEEALKGFEDLSPALIIQDIRIVYHFDVERLLNLFDLIDCFSNGHRRR